MNYGINNLYPKPATDNAGVVLAGQTLAVAGTAVKFTAFNSNTSLIAMDISGDDCYVTFDNSTPSGTNGHVLYAKEKVLWSKATAEAAKFISTGAGTRLYASQFQL
jgi:hypothetical protein